MESPLVSVEQEHRLVLQGEDAMEVDDSSSESSSSSSPVADEVAASMLQLVEEASNKAWNEAPTRAVNNDVDGIDVAATTSESGRRRQHQHQRSKTQRRSAETTH